MDRFNFKNIDDLIKYINKNNIKNVKISATDIDGVMRGKYINKDKFISVLKSDLGFCDVIFGWDSSDELYTDSKVTGWHSAYPDAKAKIDISTCRKLPLEEGTLFFLMDFEESQPHGEVCPRSLLKRVINQAKKMGISFKAAAEFEFFLFEETPNSIREKNYQNLTNFTPDMFGYSLLRSSVHSDFYKELLEMCEKMDMAIEGIHTETGPGVIETALVYDELLKAADKATLFKTFTKVFAQKRGLLATFMAKWSNKYPGQSGHLHISAWDGDKNLFFDENKEHNMSDMMRWFIGGQQKLMPELLSMIAPTCNSFTRLIPGFWAPTQATWGVDNRTCAIRAIPGSQKSQRVEYRVTAADINPYIALSAAIGSGLWGIKNKVEPSKPIEGNAYAKNLPKQFHFPRTLYDAALKLKSSKAARELFGDTFVEHYAMSREWEDNEQKKAVTDWQLKRYFEII